MPPGAIFWGGMSKPTGNALRGGSIEGSPNFVWVISSDLDRFKRARVLGFIRPVVPLAGLPLCLYPGVGVNMTLQERTKAANRCVDTC